MENWTKGLQDAPVCGAFGVCLDEDGEEGCFEYLIADMYLPWKAVPPECTVRVIPESTWAVFPCRGPLPKTLQDVNTKMWKEWLPGSKGYRLAANMNLEVYAPPAEKPENTYSEIWLPVEKI